MEHEPEIKYDLPTAKQLSDEIRNISYRKKFRKTLYDSDDDE